MQDDAALDGLEQLVRAVRGVRGSEALLRAVFERNPVGMALLGPGGVVVEVNAAFCRILGRDRRELVGTPVDDLRHPEDPGPLTTDPAERRFRHADGRNLWVQASVVDVVGGERRWDDEETDDPAVGRDRAGPEEGKGLSAVGRLLCVDDTTVRHDTEQLLLHAAMHDSLTNLPNRRLLRDRLDTALARAVRTGSRIAVLFVDLDDFKQVNDTLGHDAGDDMLVAVARNIITVLRPSDTVARLGGDEFVVVCEDVQTEHEVSQLTDRVLEAVRRPVPLRGQIVQVTASVGVAVADDPRHTSDELIRHADLAMYRAKRQPASDLGVALRPAPAPGSDASTDLVADLRHAIQNDQLTLYYQPIVRSDGRLLGMEALLRWPHPRRGLLLPADFLPLVAGTDLARPVSDWVLRTALVDAAALHDPQLRVSVNMWAGEIGRPGFADTVAGLLTWAGVQPRSLYLELRGRELEHADPVLAEEIRRLRELGVGIAVDDAGEASPALDLRHWPVDTVKIDRALVARVVDDPGTAAAFRIVAATARASGRQAVATGVETTAQLDRVRELGCDRLQGHLAGRPRPLIELRPVLAERRVDLRGGQP